MFFYRKIQYSSAFIIVCLVFHRGVVAMRKIQKKEKEICVSNFFYYIRDVEFVFSVKIVMHPVKAYACTEQRANSKYKYTATQAENSSAQICFTFYD